jgi:hypothetical protein
MPLLDPSDVPALFAHGVDDRRADDVAGLFAVDGVIAHAVLGDAVGHDGIRDRLTMFPPSLVATQHSVGGVRTVVEPTAATVDWDMLLVHIFADGDATIRADAGARYQATLAPEGEGWLVQRLDIRPLWADPRLPSLFGVAP